VCLVVGKQLQVTSSNPCTWRLLSSWSLERTREWNSIRIV
jgi:hypothetical protein